MKNKKKIVWDLFGGGQNSVYLSIKESNKLDKFDVYTFDITKPIHSKQFHLDLSQDNIVDIFKQFPQPDIIVASPLCQSFSNILNMKGGGTCFWKLNEKKDKLVQRSKKEFEELKSGFTKNLNAEVQLFLKKLGKKCIDNTIDLIKFYKPKYWYIENPKQSLIWKYITLNRKDFYAPKKMFLNNASYGKYGFLTSKETNFMSNIKMDLFKGKIEPPYYVKEINGKKYYVLKDDETVKLRRDLDSRMIGISSINKMIKARNVNSGMGGMDFVQRQKTPIQKNKMSTEQICESGPASAIPHKLVTHIFSYFEDLDEFESFNINLIDLIKSINKIDQESNLKIHKILFFIYGMFYKKFSLELFHPNFSAQKNGPIEKDFCKIYKNDKKEFINKFILPGDFRREHWIFLNQKISWLSSFKTSELVTLSYKNKWWIENYRNKKNEFIKKDLQDSF
ncbi:MAG: hypothetical protein HUJ42_03555 [Malacoplasma sp.]|nr:hypothetical protein [Malacoplasma sp.]